MVRFWQRSDGMKYGAEAYKVSLSRGENHKNRRRARCKERRAGRAAVKEQLGWK